MSPGSRVAPRKSTTRAWASTVGFAIRCLRRGYAISCYERTYDPTASSARSTSRQSVPGGSQPTEKRT